MPKPRCPSCRSKKVLAVSPQLYRCQGCNGFFDSTPNEGGSHSNNPERSAIMKENWTRDRRRDNLKGGLG